VSLTCADDFYATKKNLILIAAISNLLKHFAAEFLSGLK